MASAAQYLMRIVCAAAVCGLALQFLPDTGGISAVMKLMTGIFMTVVLLNPIHKIDFSNIGTLWDTISMESERAVEEGSVQAQAAVSDIIKTNAEAYILSEAAKLGLDITAEVTLTSDQIPVPKAVTLTGKASPYTKERLQAIIKTQLDISEEDQVWI